MIMAGNNRHHRFGIGCSAQRADERRRLLDEKWRIKFRVDYYDRGRNGREIPDRGPADILIGIVSV